MKKKLILFLVSCLFNSLCGFSQIAFQAGYIINNNDEKIECQIKNIDWKDNPKEFEYKLSDATEVVVGSFANTKEFGIIGTKNRYIRAIVNIDRSSDVIESMSKLKNPIFNEEQLFLKVVLEGKASLFAYEEASLIRYFYQMEDTDIEQLVFMNYRTSDKKILTNNQYRQQLWNDLNCQTLQSNDFSRLQYKEKALLNLFIRFNQCKGVSYEIAYIRPKGDFFDLNLRVGVNYSSLSISSGSFGTLDTEFDAEVSPRIGLEAEIVMPFNNSKWSFIAEPTYQFYKAEKINFGSNAFAPNRLAIVEYKSIELPIGIRYYIFLNQKSKVFINASYIFDFDFSSQVGFVNQASTRVVEITSGSSLVYGMGYNFNKKCMIEIRYGSRNILKRYSDWQSNYNVFSFILGYRLF
ncbi:MAG: tRNA modification GTPase [Cyclobacteriaceae bacterium]